MLPKIHVPKTKCNLPISKKEVEVRAFTLGEQKNLLLAKESGTGKDIENAIIACVKDCIVFKDDINLYELPITDLLSLLIAIMGLSRGTESELHFVCNNQTVDGPCKTRFSKKVSLKDFVVKGKFKDKMILKTSGVALEMKYPTLSIEQKIQELNIENDIEKAIYIYALCISAVYSGDDVYSEFTLEEMAEWLKSFPQESFLDIKKFFDALPQNVLSVELVCPKCGTKMTKEYVGLEGFFMLHSQE